MIRNPAVKLFVYGFLALTCFVMIIPFVYMVSLSLCSDSEIFHFPPPLVPEKLMFSNAIRAWDSAPFFWYFINTVIVAGSITTLHLFFDPLAGYTFAKFRFFGRDKLFMLIISTSLMIPFFVRMIPLYIIVSRLGWTDSYFGLILPFIMHGYGIFLMRQFIMPIPNDYIDSARIDGCTEFGIFLRIILPMCKPALITDGLFTFIYNWNAFLWPLIVINSPNMRTLTLGLLVFRQEHFIQWNLMAVGALFLFLPAFMVFLVAQRYFVRGVVMSGLKG